MEQAEQSRNPKESIIWPERKRGEDAEAYWVRALAANLQSPMADKVAIAMVFGSIMGQKEKREGRDGLTGLKTVSLFLKDVEEAVDHVYRQREVGHPEQLCLVLIDIDDLKKLNKDLGNRKADLVIRAVAHLIGRGRRKEDVIARMGGDEFAILLPDCNAQDAMKISEGIRRDVERQAGTTLSIGVAELGRHDSPVDLLEKAQVARELAKGNNVGDYRLFSQEVSKNKLFEIGKNKVVFWVEGMPAQVEQNNG